MLRLAADAKGQARVEVVKLVFYVIFTLRSRSAGAATSRAVCRDPRHRDPDPTHRLARASAAASMRVLSMSMMMFMLMVMSAAKKQARRYVELYGDLDGFYGYRDPYARRYRHGMDRAEPSGAGGRFGRGRPFRGGGGFSCSTRTTTASTRSARSAASTSAARCSSCSCSRSWRAAARTRRTARRARKARRRVRRGEYTSARAELPSR